MTPPSAVQMGGDSPLALTVTDGIARIQLNRPASGNAINLALARSLLETAAHCSFTSDIRCVVLTARGRSFCAGGDLAEMAAAGDGVSGYLSELAGTLHLAVTRLMRMPKPLLTLVNGPAAGAGMSLALIGDVVLAGSSASFMTAYGAVGLSPDGGMSWLLPRLVGVRLAQELIITNRRLSSAEAASHGLITRVVDDGELEGQGALMAQKLRSAATGAIGTARALLLEAFRNGLETHLDLELRSIAERGASTDAREGIAAFIAKRQPEFGKATTSTAGSSADGN